MVGAVNAAARHRLVPIVDGEDAVADREATRDREVLHTTHRFAADVVVMIRFTLDRAAEHDIAGGAPGARRALRGFRGKRERRRNLGNPRDRDHAMRAARGFYGRDSAFEQVIGDLVVETRLDDGDAWASHRLSPLAGMGRCSTTFNP